MCNKKSSNYLSNFFNSTKVVDLVCFRLHECGHIITVFRTIMDTIFHAKLPPIKISKYSACKLSCFSVHFSGYFIIFKLPSFWTKFVAFKQSYKQDVCNFKFISVLWKCYFYTYWSYLLGYQNKKNYSKH